MVGLLFLLLLALCIPLRSEAATINAASCSPTDVQAAHTAATNGDTLQLPTCTYTTWNTTVIFTKNLTVKGNGTANTIIQRSRIAPTNDEMFRITGTTGFVVQNFTIDGTYDTDPSTWEDIGILVTDAVDFRIHHMQFQNLSRAIQTHGNPTVYRGVIDHNTFTDIYYCGGFCLGYGVAVHGDGSYPALTLGTAQNIFIEDNTFTRIRHTATLNNGGRYVFRYNTIIDNREDAAAIDVHGLGAWPRGGRQYEIYNNTITNSVARFGGVGIRGGDGVIFNNSMSSSIIEDIQLEVEQGCGGSYPQQDQIRDLSIWNNVLNEGGATASPVIYCPVLTVLNRDFFLSARGGYTPYTYPHPATLTGGSAAPTVAITAPTSSPTLSTSITPLTTLAGTASDDVAVSSVTWACPTCTPTSGTATGTTSWSVASIGLTLGDNVITVTATDGDSQTAQDSLTATLTSATAAPTVLRLVH